MTGMAEALADLGRAADRAERAGDWTAARERFPDDAAIQEGLRIAMIHAAPEAVDEKSTPAGARPTREDETVGGEGLSPRALMLEFESLGSGCEFGLVQRHFGAEPLGLLRWTTIPAVALAHALDVRFEGLGDPDGMRLFEFLDTGEYFLRVERHHLEMHTFVAVEGADYDRLFQRQRQRLAYLRTKLIDDLEAPASEAKTFVCKQHVGSMPDGEARAVHRALRRYGAHTLLCVRPADAANPNGVVRVAEPGLLFGYLDALSPTNNAEEIRYESWLAICRAAHALRGA